MGARKEWNWPAKAFRKEKEGECTQYKYAETKEETNRLGWGGYEDETEVAG
jgi:hypothetical protein